MKASDLMLRSGLLLLGVAALLGTRAGAGAFSLVSDSEKLTAVNSKTHNGYARTYLPDGSLRPETYGFAIGGNMYLSPRLEYSMAIPTSDPGVDHFDFSQIERVIEGPLASQKYVATSDPEKADLIIAVYWGRTIGTSAFNYRNARYGPDQDRINRLNARLLGFANAQVFEDDEASLSVRSNLLKEVNFDRMSAVAADRYYVILMAFDFQALYKQKQTRLLWETRFSLSERHHDFREEVPKMAKYASQYFGQDSDGLILKPIPEGRIDVGEAKSLGEAQ
jgi:hypothetical protein